MKFYSTLIVTNICGQRTAEEVNFSHRRALKTVMKMINTNSFVDGGYSHRLKEFSHTRENFSSFVVIIDGSDVASIDIHTIESD